MILDYRINNSDPEVFYVHFSDTTCIIVGIVNSIKINTSILTAENRKRSIIVILNDSKPIEI